MATTQTSEQRELALIGKVEMRIALADSDLKLQSVLQTYLAALLLKLLSEHQTVRNKVIAVCQHVNGRVKPQDILLPVAALVKQFKEQENALVRHFDLLYILQGVVRLTNAERAELLPIVLKGISRSGSHGSQIFNLLLRLLEAFILPLRGSNEDAALREHVGLSDEDADYTSYWIGRLFSFLPQKVASSTCPGLSPEDYAFLTLQNKEDVWNPSLGGLKLSRSKSLAAKLLASGLFNDSERFLPALLASADPAAAVSGVGDDILKRALPNVDLEDERWIKQLYDLYFGSGQTARVRPPLRLKILGLLNKSIRSTSFANNIVKIVDDGIASPIMDGEDVVMAAGQIGSGVGLEATKLRTAIFSYVNFVARYGEKEALHSVAQRVVLRLRDFIENQGWPRPGGSEDLTSRGYAYEVIGLLAKAGPRSILVEQEHPSLDLLRWLFDSLAKDAGGGSVTLSLDDALSTVLSAMTRLKLKSFEQDVLEDLLVDEISQSADLEGSKRLRSTRYVALRFANRCLPYNSVKARWVDLVGLGAVKDRAEVREEAERGLSPYWYRMLNGSIGGAPAEELRFPSFEAIVDQCFAGRTSSATKGPLALARQAQTSYPDSFHQITTFSRRMLFAEALTMADVAVDIDSEWERRLDVAVENSVDARNAIRSHVSGLIEKNGRSLHILLFALLEGLTGKSSAGGERIIEFLSLAPEVLTRAAVPHVDALLSILQSNKHDRRLTAAQVFGILASHFDADPKTITAQVNSLQDKSSSWTSAVGAVSNQVHGSITALGFYYSRLAFRGADLSASSSYNDFLRTLFAVILESRDKLLQESGYIALGQLCMFNAITIEQAQAQAKIRVVIDKVYDVAKGGDEAAIICLGQLTMVMPEEAGSEDSDLQYVQEQLHKLHEIRQAEVHFTVGEAMSYVACGWKSSALENKLDIEGQRPNGQNRLETLGNLLDRTLKDCENTSLKKAAVMWLLCLVQFCGAEAEVQQRLPKCQMAFKRCLGDRDELVQETASRGLGLVYEKGDRRLKNDLVHDLVSSFSSDKQSQLAGNVSADTELFEPGALPTGDGSVSTYKDIMSLASEVGDSSLVYRFMSMASSNAIWSSRAAFGRFGLSSVLSDSSVDGYMANNPKLYPKLFRYRFDPNSGVQTAMNDIWKALVKDSAAAIDKYFDAIIEDLLVSILGKEWRVRQASCAAIADLVSGQALEKYERFLERIWTQCFKVLDDIKESVRSAASSLARTLTGVLTRALEADHSSTKNASAMLKHVLPFLLSSSGMDSSAKEVQAFSVHTLLEIIKKSNGSTLRPFIPELVERLIGLLSSLEPEAVNYVHMNASKYNLTEQKIDDMRLSSVRNSPIMEAIERCLDLLDETSMRELQPRLESAMKSAVGLPSKVGSSRILVSLSTRRMVLYKPFADDFLRLIEKLVLDRNETVASSYAMAAGYVARGASDKQILRLTSFAKRLYFESEGDRAATTPRRSITAGELMYAMAKHASDRVNALASSILPFLFVAKHDTNDLVKEQFVLTWDESVGGSRAVLLYLDEIVGLCVTNLDSPQWTLKHTSARAVAEATNALSSLETNISESAGQRLWPALEKALGGKTWDGKETVLFAFVKFVEKGQAFYMSRADVKSAITKIAIREARRQNAAYRQHSVRVLGQVAVARVDIDMSGSVLELVQPLLSPPNEDDEMDVDDDSTKKSGDVIEATQAAAVEAVLASVNPSILEAHKLNEALDHAMRAISTVQSRAASVRRALYASLGTTFDRVREAGKGGLVDVESTTLESLLFERDEVEALRSSRADSIAAIARSSPLVVAKVKSGVAALHESETSRTVRERLGAALTRASEASG